MYLKLTDWCKSIVMNSGEAQKDVFCVVVELAWRGSATNRAILYNFKCKGLRNNFQIIKRFFFLNLSITEKEYTQYKFKFNLNIYPKNVHIYTQVVLYSNSTLIFFSVSQ